MLDDSNRIIYKPAQYDAIKQLIDKRIADGSLHPDLLDDRLAELALSIQSTDFATKLQNITPLSKIRSNLLQDIVDRLYIDINTLYKSIEHAENTVNLKNRKIQQQLAASQDVYLKVKSDVKTYIDGFKNPNYDEVRKITFYDKSNNTSDESPATIDQKGSKLKINGTHTLVNSVAKITPSYIVNGSTYIVSGEIESIVDSNPNTYWQATVVSEARVESFSSVVEMRFNSLQSISSISLLPSCPYPQTISNIEWSINGTNYQTVPGFNPLLATQNTDYVVIDFSAITVRFIRVTLVQSNGIFRDKLIPETNRDTDSESISNRLVQNLAMIDYSNPESQSDDIKNNITLAIINAAVYSSNILTRVNGYEYSFGLAEVLFFRSEYDFSSTYLSSSFVNHKNAFLVKLNTTEIGTENTDIEYSLDFGDNIRIPILPDNTNNFVKNELLKFTGDSLVANTRFTIDMSRGVTVYKNRVKLKPSQYVFHSQSITLLNGELGAPIDNSVFYSVAYFAKNGTEVNILDSTNSQPFDESFTETAANGELGLTYYPFIEYGIVNDLVNFYYDNGTYKYSGDLNTLLTFSTDNPEERSKAKENELSSLVNVLYLDGIAYGNIPSTKRTYTPIMITVDGHIARNITNYIGNDQVGLAQNPVGQTSYDYIQQGNKIIFGTRIVGKIINVHYNVLAKHIGLEAVLRRISANDDSITPVLKDATLFIKARNK